MNELITITLPGEVVLDIATELAQNSDLNVEVKSDEKELDEGKLHCADPLSLTSISVVLGTIGAVITIGDAVLRAARHVEHKESDEGVVDNTAYIEIGGQRRAIASFSSKEEVVKFVKEALKLS